jgi:hypothetical protein
VNSLSLILQRIKETVTLLIHFPFPPDSGFFFGGSLGQFRELLTSAITVYLSANWQYTLSRLSIDFHNKDTKMKILPTLGKGTRTLEVKREAT